MLNIVSCQRHYYAGWIKLINALGNVKEMNPLRPEGRGIKPQRD
jgi:hypothetical protein